MQWPWNRLDSIPSVWRRRITDLEDEVNYLGQRFERLRGTVAGTLSKRGKAKEAAEEEGAIDPPGMPVDLDPKSREIWLRRLRRNDVQVQRG